MVAASTSSTISISKAGKTQLSDANFASLDFTQFHVSSFILRFCTVILSVVVIFTILIFANLFQADLHTESTTSKGDKQLDVYQLNQQIYQRMPLIPDSFDTEGLPIFGPSPPLDTCLHIANGTQSEKIKITAFDKKQDEQISVTCDEVRSRGNYNITPSSNFSIAYIRIVYKDYHLHELILNLLYSPANSFCYSIDKKATDTFKQQMQNLSQCFPNVHVDPVQFSIDSAGHNMDRAFLSCMKLLRDKHNWNYTIIMQNHDIPLRTNSEMVEILKTLNGSNSLGLLKPIAKRVPKYKDWSFRALRLFKNDSLNDDRTLTISKGNVGSIFCRKFVEYLLDEINPTIFLERLHTIWYGNDEMFFQTLNADDNIDAPGGLTRRCLGKDSGFIGRYVKWTNSRKNCKSHIIRHGVCILCYLDIPNLLKTRYLFANKMMPETDYTSIACLAKYLRARALTEGHERLLNLNQYATMLNVLYNNRRTYWRQHPAEFCPVRKVTTVNAPYHKGTENRRSTRCNSCKEFISTAETPGA